MADPGDKLEILLVSGVEGPSLYLNDYRIAGPKPWGGGHILQEWEVDRADLEAALNRSARAPALARAIADQDAEGD